MSLQRGMGVYSPDSCLFPTGSLLFRWFCELSPEDREQYPSPPMPTGPPPPADIIHPGPGAVEEVVAGSQARYKAQLDAFYGALAGKIDDDEKKKGIPSWVWLVGGGLLLIGFIGGRR